MVRNKFMRGDQSLAKFKSKNQKPSAEKARPQMGGNHSLDRPSSIRLAVNGSKSKKGRPAFPSQIFLVSRITSGNGYSILMYKKVSYFKM